MSIATVPPSRVSGGKVWTPPTTLCSRLDWETGIFLTLLFFIGSSLLIAITNGVMLWLDIRIPIFDSILPNAPKPITGDMGYPTQITANTHPDILPYFITAVLVVVVLIIMLSIPDTWDIFAVVLFLFSLTVMVLGTSFSLQNTERKISEPVSPITWMNERYDFTPIANITSNSIYDGMLMRDGTNKETIVEVKESNEKYFLYTLNGQELPLKN